MPFHYFKYNKVDLFDFLNLTFQLIIGKILTYFRDKACLLIKKKIKRAYYNEKNLSYVMIQPKLHEIFFP